MYPKQYNKTNSMNLLSIINYICTYLDYFNVTRYLFSALMYIFFLFYVFKKLITCMQHKFNIERKPFKNYVYSILIGKLWISLLVILCSIIQHYKNTNSSFKKLLQNQAEPNIFHSIFLCFCQTFDNDIFYVYRYST